MDLVGLVTGRHPQHRVDHPRGCRAAVAQRPAHRGWADTDHGRDCGVGGTDPLPVEVGQDRLDCHRLPGRLDSGCQTAVTPPGPRPFPSDQAEEVGHRAGGRPRDPAGFRSPSLSWRTWSGTRSRRRVPAAVAGAVCRHSLLPFRRVPDTPLFEVVRRPLHKRVWGGLRLQIFSVGSEWSRMTCVSSGQEPRPVAACAPDARVHHDDAQNGRVDSCSCLAAPADPGHFGQLAEVESPGLPPYR